MKNSFFFTLFCLIFYYPSISYANLEKGKWNFIKDPDYCYIGSLPEIKDIPDGKIRGDTYILVYIINNSKNPIVQIDAGYPYKKNVDVRVTIDNSEFIFYSDDDTAWTNQDSKVIYAMQKGMNLKVEGESSRGTKTEDTYTLVGFTAAYKKLTNDC